MRHMALAGGQMALAGGQMALGGGQMALATVQLEDLRTDRAGYERCELARAVDQLPDIPEGDREVSTVWETEGGEVQ